MHVNTKLLARSNAPGPTVSPSMSFVDSFVWSPSALITCQSRGDKARMVPGPPHPSPRDVRLAPHANQDAPWCTHRSFGAADARFSVEIHAPSTNRDAAASELFSSCSLLLSLSAERRGTHPRKPPDESASTLFVPVVIFSTDVLRKERQRGNGNEGLRPRCKSGWSEARGAWGCGGSAVSWRGVEVGWRRSKHASWVLSNWSIPSGALQTRFPPCKTGRRG